MTGARHLVEEIERIGAEPFHAPRRPGQKSYRCREMGPGLIVDFARSGKPIGIEIIDPAIVTVAAMNRILRQLKQATLTRRDLVPLKAA